MSASRRVWRPVNDGSRGRDPAFDQLIAPRAIRAQDIRQRQAARELEAERNDQPTAGLVGDSREELIHDPLSLPERGSLGRAQDVSQGGVGSRDRPKFQFRDVGGRRARRDERADGGGKWIKRAIGARMFAPDALFISPDELGDSCGQKLGVGAKMVQQVAPADASSLLNLQRRGAGDSTLDQG